MSDQNLRALGGQPAPTVALPQRPDGGSSMRLSEAIRLGAMLKPQTWCFYSVRGTCALGAAADAIGEVHGDPMAFDVLPAFQAMRERWPLLLRLDTPAPCGCKLSRAVEDIIPHLNDYHRWTREQIADWVATLEPQDAPVTPAPVAVEV